MKSEDQIVRIEVCEKCFEHAAIDLHSETLFQEAFSQVSEVCSSIGIKTVKNFPYRYLRKIKDSKLSTKRYLDTSQNRIVEYPRKSAFEIYYLNILVFSRLKSFQFPNYQLLKSILQQIKKIYRYDSLLKGFEIFRDLEIQWRQPSKKVDCLYEYINHETNSQFSDSKVEEAIKKLIQSKLQLSAGNKKIIFPYSIYIGKQKQGKMENIYCPRSLKYKHKVHKNVISKVRSYVNRNTSGKKEKKQEKSGNHFPRQRLRSSNIFSNRSKEEDKLLISNCTQTLNKQSDDSGKRSKNLYSSFLDSIKQKRIRQIQTAKTRESQKRLVSAGLSSSRPSTDKIFKKCLNKDNISHRKNIKSDNLKQASNIPQKNSKNNAVKLQNQPFKAEKYFKNRKQFTGTNGKQDNEQLLPIQSKSFKKLQQTELSNTIVEKNQSLLEKDQLTDRVRLQQLRSAWTLFSEKFNYRESANIASRFSSLENFDVNLVNEIYSGISEKRNQYQGNIDFKINGEELTSTIIQKSIKQLFSPQELKFFPVNIKEITNYATNLTQVVNTLLLSDSKIISRIFENKKSINPHGIYCVWLKNIDTGKCQPIFVDDIFALYQRQSDDMIKTDISDFVYAKPSHQNSIWFMILQKAIAKVLGGYQNIAGANISALLDILIGSPTVDFSSLSIQKSRKIFEQKNLLNKMATFYAMRSKQQFEAQKYPNIDSIIDFRAQIQNPRESKVILRSSKGQMQLNLYEFLLKYGEVTLSFFSSYYFMNQFSFVPDQLQNKVSRNQSFSCILKSVSQKNHCYFMFNFGKIPLTQQCKVSIYRCLNKQIKKNMNDNRGQMSVEKHQYEYMGQIEKFGNFFFQTELKCGQFLCVLEGISQLEGSYNCPNLMMFSEKKIEIFQKNMVFEHILTENKSSKIGMKTRTPQIIMTQTNKHSDEHSKFKIQKKFLVDGDSSEKQNKGQHFNE